MGSRDVLFTGFLRWILALLAVASTAERATAEWGGTVTVEGVYTDNIRSQSGPGRRGEYLTALGGGIGWVQSEKRYLPAEVSLFAKGRLFSDSPEFDYYEVRPRAIFEFGRNELQLEYILTPDRLFFDRSEDAGLGGAFYTGHTFAGRIGRKIGDHKQLRVYLSWDLAWRNFAAPDDERDDLTALGEILVRYLVSPFFVPELGFEYGRRNAVRNNYDRDQGRLTVGIASKVTSWLVLKVRYRFSRRDYSVGVDRGDGGRRNRNFGRLDDLHDVEARVTVPVPYVDGMWVRARYKYRDATSSRPGRTFTRNELGVEIAYSMKGSSW